MRGADAQQGQMGIFQSVFRHGDVASFGGRGIFFRRPADEGQLAVQFGIHKGIWRLQA